MIGGDFDTPIMYQDLANYTMSPMSMPFGAMSGMYGGGIGNTSYLGGVQMRPQPDADRVELINKKHQESKNTFKKAMLALGVIFLAGFVPVIRKNIKNAGGLGKYIKTQWNALKTWFNSTPSPKPSAWQRFKNFFKRKPKAPTSPTGTPKPSVWQKFKNIFKRKPKTP